MVFQQDSYTITVIETVTCLREIRALQCWYVLYKKEYYPKLCEIFRISMSNSNEEATTKEKQKFASQKESYLDFVEKLLMERINCRKIRPYKSDFKRFFLHFQEIVGGKPCNSFDSCTNRNR